MAIEDEVGNDLDVVVCNGELVGDFSCIFCMVILGFLVNGGDGYFFFSGEFVDLVDLVLLVDVFCIGLVIFVFDGFE